MSVCVPLTSAPFGEMSVCVNLQACLVAVVVPDPDFLSSWTKRTLGLEGSYQELCGRAVIFFLFFFFKSLITEQHAFRVHAYCFLCPHCKPISLPLIHSHQEVLLQLLASA